jgi:aminoglycoside 6'-N-acetyltransferase
MLGRVREVATRRLTRHDLPDVARWMTQPHVARWWHDRGDLAAVQEHYLPAIDGLEPTEVFIIEVDGRSVGLIQRYLIDDYPQWAAAVRATGTVDSATAAGIDYLVGEPAMTRQGVGSAAIVGFTADTFVRYGQVDAVVAAPQQANPGSWRALERAGFIRLWAGMLESDDPSDAGPAYLYAKFREPGSQVR